jgi:capsular polysaccharide biosynthesis protein
MELKDYLKIIGKSWATIFGIAAIVTILVTIWTMIQPLRYDASNTIVVNKPDPVSQRDASYYQYDKYYAIQASSLYSDTLAAWLSSPDTAKEIYEKAGYPVPDVTIKKLAKIFKPRQQPPVTVSVTIRDQDKDKAERLVNAAVDVLKSKVDQQHASDAQGDHFEIFNGKTIVLPAREDLLLNMVIGAVAGLIVGFMTAFLKEYLRS